MRRHTPGLAIVTLAASVVLSPSGIATPPVSRDAQWRADLEFLTTELASRHVDLFHEVSEADFAAAARELDRRIPTLEDHEIVVRMAQLVATCGDSHTRLFAWTMGENTHYFPYQLESFGDDVRVVVAPADRPHLLGARVLRIGREPTEQAIDLLSTVVAAENDSLRRSNVPRVTGVGEFLHATGISDERLRVQLTLVLADGRTTVEEFEASTAKGERPPVTRLSDVEGFRQPLYLEPRDGPYWYEQLVGRHTMYLKYDKCRDDPRQPFAEFAAEVLQRAQEHGADRLVVDLRHNGGGNSAVARPLVRSLRDHAVFGRRGHLFVIIGRDTFSSGLMNAVELQEQCGAILVGEPTGGKPNHFGEVRTFQLPNHGHVVQYSTRFWRLRPDDDSATLVPDVTATPSFQMLMAGRDAALDACLSWTE